LESYTDVSNLPAACQSTARHQVLNMANFQGADLPPVWLICLLAASNKERSQKYIRYVQGGYQ